MSLSNRPAGKALRAMSLDAMRGFESAARHLSFTAAAEELFLTQSAISKQVKSLEDALGRPLFLRGNRGLSLTGEGRQLYEAARGAIDHLETALDKLLRTDRESVSVTTTPSFAALWLAPKLARFQAQEPGIDVRVDASEARLNLEREGIDLAVRLGPADAGAGLLQERLMLVAAPGLAARIREPQDILRLSLLVYYDPATRFAWMSWPHWYQRMGLPQTPQQPCLYFSQYEHVLHAATQGAGVAIGRTPLVLDLLRAKQLEVVLPDQVGQGMSYQLLSSPQAQGRPAVHKLRDWIERELAAELMA